MQLQRRALHVLAAMCIAVGMPALGQAQDGQGQIQPPGQAREKVRGYQQPTTTLSPAIGKLTGPAPGAAREIALSTLRAQLQALGLAEADLSDVAITSELLSPHSGVTHVYVQQQYRGVPVNGAVANVNVAADGSVLSLGSSFVGNLALAVSSTSATRGPADAAAAAAQDANLSPTEPFAVVEARGGARQETLLSDGGVATGPVTASLVYQPVGPGEVRLGWLVELEAVAGGAWHTVVDGSTGAVIHAFDLVDYDHWPAPFVTDAPGEIVIGKPAGVVAFSEAVAAEQPGPITNAYRVFAIPKESPSDGPRTLEINPADPLASPFGWHDTDGAPGPEFTITRGNNVHAGVDLVAPNGIDPGGEAEGGPDLVFDFPLDLTQGPETYRPFAVTNLFYWNNLVHDMFYQYGFTEEAGNFQVNNYGRTTFAGGDNDDVRAEAQDFSGTNNANFFTPADGLRPRMQMFIWTSPTPNEVVVASGGAAGTYPASGAAFGPTFAAAGPKTGSVVPVVSSTGTPGEGCGPLANAAEIAGNIAMADRGTCPFVDKVQNAQNAGAIAVIMANNVAGAPITMGGASATIVIPSGMISLDNANLLRANLPLVATVQAGAGAVNRDSDLDAGVIAHEYGHGISNRLTGGRTVVNCLGNQEQMGEGWSDLIGLFMTAKAGDTGPQRRGIGTYVIYQPTDGNGIRPTPYSTDMSINPSTYDLIKTAAVPHGVGYVWATMVWDMYWNLVDKHGFNPDLYGAWHTGGNNLAIQLVTDGMKLQPCQPGFVTGRNAILQADLALTAGANQCAIWQAFARRGLGLSADQGLSTSRLDGTEAFDLPAMCQPGAGPFAPVSNDQTHTAGSTIPVRFSLGGDLGLNIFAAGYPASQQVSCTTGGPIGGLVPTNIAGGSTLTYDAESTIYHYPWKTEAAWRNSCRAFLIQLNDGTTHSTVFRFR
jgi:extracellular elastinolytic metalloproteinase